MPPGGSSVIGVIGGMGPLATVSFFEALTARTPAASDQEHLQVIINSDPRTPDRSAYILGRGEDPRPALIASANTLRGAGATLLVMPCNTANVFSEDVARAVGLPVVPWLDIAVDAAAQAAQGPTAILATSGTIRTRVFQDRFESAGLPYVVPLAGVQSQVMDVIYGPEGIKSCGRRTISASRAFTKICESMADLGATSALLGCTELPLTLDPSTPITTLVTVDPAIAVVDRIMTYIKDDLNEV